MLCEKCGKNIATTHIHSIINGVKTEKHLCAECAAKESGGSFSDLSLNGMLASMFGDVMSINSASSRVRCSCCGSTFSDIANTGKAGCPQCYKTFYNEFLPYIKRVHGAVKHIGKAVNNISNGTDKQDTVLELKKQLAELVRQEKFEEAASLRDRIREMEAGK